MNHRGTEAQRAAGKRNGMAAKRRGRRKKGGQWRARAGWPLRYPPRDDGLGSGGELSGRGDDAAVAGGGEVLQGEADGFDADRGGDARAFVQEENPAGSESARDGGGDGGGIVMAALEAAGAPADAGETLSGEGRFESEIFDAGGGAKTGGADAGGDVGGEAGGEFAAQAGRARAPERGERVGVRVVADLVAGGGDGADEVGVGGGVFADEEKRGAGVVSGEQGEEARGVGGIGPVVES